MGNRLRRLWPALAGFGMAACGTRPPTVHRVLTAATFDSLPVYHVAARAMVCLGTGYTLCPEHVAVANWVSDTSFAMWEPGRTVGIWGPHDTAGMPLENAPKGPGHYGYATGVAGQGSSYLVIDVQPGQALEFTLAGKFRRASRIPLANNGETRGFAGSQGILQQLVPHGRDRPADFTVTLVGSPADTTGRRLLDAPLPWLRLMGSEGAAEPVTPIPFFPALPVYTVDHAGGLVWSPGDKMAFSRIGRGGDTVWTIASDLDGPPITAAEIAAQRASLDSQAVPGDSGLDLIDSMVARTGKFHPAVVEVLAAPDDRVLAVGGGGSAADSIQALLISSDGTPRGRLRLGGRDRPLLFAGDSVLVFRPTASEPWEVRWLRLVPPR